MFYNSNLFISFLWISLLLGSIAQSQSSSTSVPQAKPENISTTTATIKPTATTKVLNTITTIKIQPSFTTSVLTTTTNAATTITKQPSSTPSVSTTAVPTSSISSSSPTTSDQGNGTTASGPPGNSASTKLTDISLLGCMTVYIVALVTNLWSARQ